MMGVLVTLHKKAADTGGRLLLCSLRSELQKVLQMVKLERILQIAPDKNAALKALSKS
jgi:anti-anti-sigma factor